jgi:hypothetical protein
MSKCQGPSLLAFSKSCAQRQHYSSRCLSSAGWIVLSFDLWRWVAAKAVAQTENRGRARASGLSDLADVCRHERLDV